MSSSRWRNIDATTFCTKVTDGTHDSPKRKDFGKPLITSKHIKGRSIDFENAYFISDEDSKKINLRSKVDQWDVIISMIGEYCGFCYVERKPVIDYAVKNVGIFKTGNKIKADWLYYYLNSPEGKNSLASLKSGTSQPYLSLGALRALPILIPGSEREMGRIVSILSALDDKIELNRQTNATLEAIAQAIFKEWFVDFNFPGATGEMVESELGMIPSEWRVGCFQDILNNEIGGDWGKDNSFEGGVPVISLRGTDLEQLKSFGYAPNAPVRWVKENSIEKRKVTRNDILIGGSGLGPIGRSIYCPDMLQDLYAYPLTYSNFCKRLRAETPAHAIYAERLLESIYINGEMRQYFTGTSIPNLDIQSLLAYKIIIPEAEVIEEYYKKIGKEKFDFLFNQENIYLTQIRDILLPKLMSGEIEV